MEPYSHSWSLPKILSKSGQKPSKSARLLFVALGGLFFILLVNALLGALFEGQMMPGVTIAGQSVVWKTQNQTRQLINKPPDNYKLTVVVNKQQFPASGSDLGVSYDINATTALAYGVGHSWLPLADVVRSIGRGDISYVYKLDRLKLSHFADQLAASVGKPAINATLKVVDGKIEPVPDQNGLTIESDNLEQLITNSLSNGEGPVIHAQPQVLVADVQTTQLSGAEQQANAYLNRTISLSYNDKTYTASTADIGHWLSFNPGTTPQTKHNLEVTIDKTQVKGWVQSVANDINIQPKNKQITVSNGVSSVTQEGSDGLAVDQDKTTDAIVASITNNQNLSYAIPTYTVAFKTQTTYAGGLSDDRYIEVNLSSQHLWVYQDHKVVYSSPVTSGATGAVFATVTGIFHIYYKTTNTYLNGHPYGYNYNVFVQYWMPFYLGYGLHDASWRSSFGGSDYYYGGSHGCVNLPLATATFLYSWADVGTTVWVHN